MRRPGQQYRSGVGRRSAGLEDADGALASQRRIDDDADGRRMAGDREGMGRGIERMRNLRKGQALVAALVQREPFGRAGILLQRADLERSLLNCLLRCLFAIGRIRQVRNGVRDPHLLGQHQQ